MRLFVLVFSIFFISNLPAIAEENGVIGSRWDGSFLYIMIKTDQRAIIKCIVYDKNKKPIMIETDIITPPYHEVMIYAEKYKDNFSTVECIPEKVFLKK